MLIGVLSDTHEDHAGSIPRILQIFNSRGVEMIVHCGDIDPTHVDASLFGDKPVVCALVEGQGDHGPSPFAHSPKNWILTKPGQRVVKLPDTKIYVGHKRAFEFLSGSEAQLVETMNTIRRDNDGVRWLFSGHTHHQILMETPLTTFINPGAVQDACFVAGGHEFAILDTARKQITFSRLPSPCSKKPLTVAVISDSLDISQRDPSVWRCLAANFQKYGVSHVIHCGNINEDDIGRPELADFEVHVALRRDQLRSSEARGWHLIPKDEPIVDIQGYRFYVQLGLGSELFEKSEVDMYRMSLEVQRRYPETEYILFGFTRNRFYEEGENLVLINPGDVVKDRDYAILRLPACEFVFERLSDSSAAADAQRPTSASA